MQGWYTFSNFNLTGFGLSCVTVSAISDPILKASSLVLPLTRTNKESVSPYITFACHFFVDSTSFIALSKVSLPLLTTLSPTCIKYNFWINQILKGNENKITQIYQYKYLWSTIFKNFTLLYKSSYLNAGHPSREVSWRIAICNIGNKF